MNKKRFLSGMLALACGITVAGIVLTGNEKPFKASVLLIALPIALLIVGLALSLTELAKSVVKRLKAAREREKAMRDRRRQARRNKGGPASQ